MDWLLFRLITGAIAGSFCLFLSVFSYLKNKSRRLNKIFALFNLFLGLWNLSDVAIVSAPTHTLALFLDRLSYVWGTPVIPLFFYLCVEMAGVKFEKKAIHWILLTVTVFFMLVTFTPWFIQDIKTDTFEEVPGFLFPFFMIYLVFLLGYGMVILFRAFKSATGIKKDQLKYTFLALFFAFLAGISFLSTMIVPSTPPVFYVPEMAYAGTIGYAIFKYRLMDIRIFIRRAGLLVLIYCLLVIVSAPIVFFIHHKAVSPDGIINTLLVVEVIFLAATLSLGPFFYAYFVKQSSYFREDSMAGLTHELKSPLAIIQSSLDVMAGRLESKKIDRKQQSEYIEIIRRNSERLDRFIEQLLIVFNPNSDRPTLSIQETDIVDLCRAVVRDFEDHLNEKNLTISLNVPKELVVFCDSEKIAKVVSNLLSNAIKFSRNGEIRLSIEDDDDQVKVVIHDHGEGIPNEDMSRLFERFFQGTKRGRKGAGVGLAVSKAWVEAHAGEINGESDGPGKGSRFWFTLPKK